MHPMLKLDTAGFTPHLRSNRLYYILMILLICNKISTLRGLYTYFLYITKLRYMKEEVETFQKIYIKVYGVN